MKIAIIGGGITGLTTALALQKQGIFAQVYEQSPQLKEVGAGIMLQPNAMKVLDYLNLGDAIRDQGMAIHRMEITDKNLHPLKEFKSDNYQSDTAHSIIGIHRGRLQQILYESLPSGSVHLGKCYISHSLKADKTEIQFKDSNASADIVLGADGIHSKVRQQLFPQATLRDSGQICWRGISQIDLPIELAQLGREAWARHKRFGITQISSKKTYWFAVLNAKEKITTDQNQIKSELQSQFKDFAPIVQQIIEHTDSSQIIRGELLDLKRLPTWHQESVCLIGDAAHATTPNMGQGAGQGIEDAYYISHILAKTKQPQLAFQQFEDFRRAKVDYVVNNSWRFGKMAHSTWGQPIMKFLMKISPDSVVTKQMQKLYALKNIK